MLVRINTLIISLSPPECPLCLQWRPNVCVATNRRDVPGSDICAAANSTLFDHLVGAGARAPRAGGLTRLKRNTGTAVVHIDDDVDNLPFIVRRDHRIVAAF